MTLPETIATETSRSRVLRLAGTVILSALYVLVALAKLAQMVRALRLMDDGEGAKHLFVATYAASGAVFFGILGGIMVVRSQPVRRDRRLVGWVLPIVVMVLFSFLGTAELEAESTALLFAAAVLATAGTAFMVYSLRYLGRSFGVVSDVRSFVSTGPYRWVRHPLYAGEAIATLGLLLGVLSPFTVALFCVAMALQMVRARVEEQAVTAAFPAYAAYAERTPMLIPFVPVRYGGSSSRHRPG